MIFIDSDWNPQADLQAEARVHRIGQEKNVTKQCNSCQGTLKVSSFATHYHMDYDRVDVALSRLSLSSWSSHAANHAACLAVALAFRPSVRTI